MNDIVFPLIPIIFPVIILNQSVIGLLKVYNIDVKHINVLAIIIGYILTYVYILAFNIDFNIYQIILIGLINGLSSIGFYKTSRGENQINNKVDNKTEKKTKINQFNY